MDDHSEFRVHVLLRGSAKQTCISPAAFPKAEAERILAEIDQGRRKQETISLPWLSIDGADVLAVHLEDATPEGVPHSLEEILSSLKAKGIELVIDSAEGKPSTDD